MAHKKAGGSVRNGETVSAGSIIVRQRGTHFHAGANVGLAKDDSLFAKANGKVTFVTRGAKGRKFVEIVETQQ